MGDRIIGMAHGYGLSGSGSNLWTRSVARALCREGVEVHLLCQESRPEAYDYVAETWTYEADGTPHRLFEREVDYPGRCVLHRPKLQVLPTYVRPQADSDYVFSILDLDGDAIEEYLRRNVAAFEHIVGEYGVPAFQVNHVLLLSEAARRVKERTGVAYGVMPHGSAIEYVVKKDAAMRDLAAGALEAADRLLMLNQDVLRRVHEVFPELTRVDERVRVVRAGVDTDHFRIVPGEERAEAFREVVRALEDVPRGRDAGREEALFRALEGADGLPAFRTALEDAADYPRGHPDEDVEARLGAIRWGTDPVVLFVGRLVGGKGVASVVTALPDVMAKHPDTRLVLVGNGPLREILEGLVHALGTGQRDLARRILDWADRLDPEGVRSFEPSRRHLERLEAEGKLEGWFERARKLDLERVVFTGFMEHDVLSRLFPLTDAAVFPSVVAEASPLVVAEAAASGSFPMGTDFAGMRRTLDAIGEGLPEDVRERMRIRPEPEGVVCDIADNLTAILGRTAEFAVPLREVAVEHFDWRRIAASLERAFEGTGSRAAAG